MLFFKDTSGTGIATERQDALHRLGHADTHAGPSNLHWGLDGWIYGTVGYSGFSGEVGGETSTSARASSASSPMARSSNSSARRTTTPGAWASAKILKSSPRPPTTTRHFISGIPNRYFETVRGWAAHRPATICGRLALLAHHRQGPPGRSARRVHRRRGAELYTARTYPQWYWNHVNFVDRADGPPGRPVRAGAARQRVSWR